jgi:hypothetical protein
LGIDGSVEIESKYEIDKSNAIDSKYVMDNEDEIAMIG